MIEDVGVEDVTGPLARRFTTATVLLHAAVAEHLGLGPADHKCLDLLVERGPLAASELAAITGLTSGAITGVVARLERSGRVRREPDPRDGRRQLLQVVPEGLADVAALFASFREPAAALLDGFDAREVAAVGRFLERGTDWAYRRAALLRAERLAAGGRRRPAPVEAS